MSKGSSGHDTFQRMDSGNGVDKEAGQQDQVANNDEMVKI
jgi:hypothetical protein